MLSTLPESKQSQLAWIAYFVIGTGLLAPWNALLTGIDYFAAIFPGKPMDRLFTITYLPACLLVLVLLLRFKALATYFPPRVRIINSFIGFALIMLAIPILGLLGLDPAPPAHPEDTSAYFPAVLATTVVIGVLDGLCQGAVFADVAALPSRFTQAVVSGTACSGFLVSVLRISSKAIWAEQEKGVGFPGLRASTELYFLAAALLSIVCAAAYGLLLPRLPAVQQQRRQQGEGFLVAELLTQDSTKDGSSPGQVSLEAGSTPLVASAEEQMQERVSVGLKAGKVDKEGGSSEGLEQESLLLRLEASRSSEQELSSQSYRETDQLTAFRSCWGRLWPLCCGLLLTYIITLSIFPGFLAEDVKSNLLGDWYPILLISAFNTADLIGKLLPWSGKSWKNPGSSRPCLDRLAHKWMVAAVARILFIPAFVCAAFTNASPLIMCLLTVSLGASNGYITAGLMLGGPELLEPGQEEAGEGILVISLISGLLIGALSGFLWLLG